MMLVYGLAGILLGILAGILPGLGTSSLMILMLVPLMSADPVNVIVFYLGVLTSAQYFGSVTGILTGVPGDPSALPSSKWGFSETQQGRGPSLLYQTSKWSLISGVVSFLVFLLLMTQGWFWVKSLSVLSISILLLCAVVGIVIFSQNSLSKNTLLVLAGAVLGSIGYSENYQSYFLVGDQSVLSHGIPWMPVMVGLMVIPGIWSLRLLSKHTTITKTDSQIQESDTYSKSAVRGGVVGFLLGMVPGMSYILSSITAAKIEENISNNPRKIVVAAESANNAGAVSMLLPLFMLGLPITASESVLLVLLSTNASMQAIPLIFQTHWIEISIYFVCINIVLFLLAWKLAERVCSVIFSKLTVLIVVSLVLAIAGTLWAGYWSHTMLLTAVTLFVFTCAGVYAKNIDWSPLVYVMIMHPYIESTVYKIQQIYF